MDNATSGAPGTVRRRASPLPAGVIANQLPTPAAPATGTPRLLNQVRDAIRTRHMSPRTEEAYVHWIKRFILFHRKRHPAEMGRAEIAQFLTALAVERHVSASTQNQALAACSFCTEKCSGAIPAGWTVLCERSNRSACRWC